MAFRRSLIRRSRLLLKLKGLKQEILLGQPIFQPLKSILRALQGKVIMLLQMKTLVLRDS